MESRESLKAYIASIRNYKILTKEEQLALVEKARAGDQKAFTDLINSNLLLVVSIAKKCSRRGVSTMDLVQEGNLGLLMAAKRFKASFNTAFSTYAYLWIQQYMIRFIRNKIPMIKIPERKSELKGLYNVASLDAPLSDSEGLSLGEIVEDKSQNPESLFSEKLLAGELLSLVSTLPKNEKAALSERFGINGGGQKSLRETGERLGVSAEYVRQLENRALRRLRRQYACV